VPIHISRPFLQMMNIWRIKSPFGRIHLPRWAVGALALLTACATLVAGLIPFGAPKNAVSFANGENGICFGRHGTALTLGRFELPGGGPGGSVELWVEPAKIWARGSILTFYRFSESREFRLEQDYVALVLRLRDKDERTEDGRQVLRIENVFRKKQAFITVTSDGQETSVYIDGQLAGKSSDFKLSKKDLSGQLILANSPFRDQSWRGEVRGLAIYGTALDAVPVQQHYQNWTERGGPLPQDSEQVRALFLFREHLGSVILNAVSGGMNLEAPKRFLVVDQLRFESPVSEYHSEPTYLKNAALNIAGFIPLGFVLSLCLASVPRIKRATLLAVLAGIGVSLAIEYSQSFLATRYSGCTDLFTNTIGTWMGAILRKWLARWITVT
jgi:VanZ family protein